MAVETSIILICLSRTSFNVCAAVTKGPPRKRGRCGRAPRSKLRALPLTHRASHVVQADWCACLVLTATDRPDNELALFYDPLSKDLQRSALCCLLLDNDVWTIAQRLIVRKEEPWSWWSIWDKLRCVSVTMHSACPHAADLARRAAVPFCVDAGRRCKTSTCSAGSRAPWPRSAPRACARATAAPRPRSCLRRCTTRGTTRTRLRSPTATSCGVCTSRFLRLLFCVPRCMPLRSRFAARPRGSLDVGEFLNDSLVDYCLKRLQEELAAQLPPDELAVRPVASPVTLHQSIGRVRI